jgi:hypothetical protein
MEPSHVSNQPAEFGSPAGNPFAGLVRYLYNHNPFYVISAALILGGLHVLFHDREAVAHPNALTFNSWLLLSLLGGYGLLLAMTAGLIVRLGQVWDDARTILLTLVFLFVAISVSFDKLVLTNSVTMTQVMLVGLAFALGLSEVVLRGLGIRLPMLFRGPFYLMLALFFVYPLLMMHWLDGVGESDPQKSFDRTLWGIFFFPTVAGAITLTLLPAVWKGPAYVAENGTPWRWPLFPWSLFVILGAAIVLRAYYLSISFHPFPGTASAFGVYFLVPFLLSVCLVVFELGRSAGRPMVETIALAAPLALLWFTLPGTDHTPVYEQFLKMYMHQAGSPVLMTWWGLLGLYFYGWLRGARLAQAGVVGLLLIGSVFGMRTVDVHSLRFPALELLFTATLVVVLDAILRPRHSARWFAVAVTIVGTLTAAFWDTPFVAYAGAAPIHLLLGAVLMLGLVFRDAFARVLRHAGSLGLAAAGVACLVYDRTAHDLHASLVAAYLIALSIVAWGYWYTLRGRLQLFAACVVTSCWLANTGLLTIGLLRRVRHPAGPLLVLAGAVSFLVAAAISLMKAGVWPRVIASSKQVDESPPST